jgi:hypothetical protein
LISAGSPSGGINLAGQKSSIYLAAKVLGFQGDFWKAAKGVGHWVTDSLRHKLPALRMVLPAAWLFEPFRSDFPPRVISWVFREQRAEVSAQPARELRQICLYAK